MPKYIETCGFMGFGVKEWDTLAFDTEDAKFVDGKCVSTVDVASDNRAMCDAPGIKFENGKCVSILDITSDNRAMCDAPGVAFENGKCVSTVDVTSDNISMCDAPGIKFEGGKCVLDDRAVCDAPGVKFENGKCVVNFVDPIKETARLRPNVAVDHVVHIKEDIESGRLSGVPRGIAHSSTCKAPAVNAAPPIKCGKGTKLRDGTCHILYDDNGISSGQNVFWGMTDLKKKHSLTKNLIDLDVKRHVDQHGTVPLKVKSDISVVCQGSHYKKKKICTKGAFGMQACRWE